MEKSSRKKKIESSGVSARLHALAHNLWWSWNPSAQRIFEDLAPLTWDISHHNPIAVLKQFSEMELRARFGDREFLRRLLEGLEAFERYMKAPGPLCPEHLSRKRLKPVAYFCAEFGIHSSLPFYSGGLGVLAGDHAKSASDLGLPFVGVGLFYRQGYFQQHVDGAGYQQENYPTTDPDCIPVELVRDEKGEPLLCSVAIGSSVVYFQGWRVKVGRCPVYLLDTAVAENSEEFRGLTALAYGGDMNTRIRQEIVLGIGGVRFLRALGVSPAVFHINEGHAAFLTLELLREQRERGRSKARAEEAVRERCIFTTHTPVPAGHDRFPVDLMEFHLRVLAENMGVSVGELMDYGRSPHSQGSGEFTMTILGLRFSRAANGVSRKHGEISREMWKDLYRVKKVERVPIGHVTNGVHVPSWAARTSWEFWERHNSHKWKEHLNDPKFWKHVSKESIVSDEELWALRCTLRRELIEFLREKARLHQTLGGATGEEALIHLLNPDALTIGFARRFAPYKRPLMLFSNPSQAVTLFNDPRRPIQIILAGKAHPRDGEGKDHLRRIIEITREGPFFGKVIFIENYDMTIAKHLVSGCDVWLNTPRRPLEASGTSGQKVSINGGLHLSMLDGWWAEAFNGQNGWAIGVGGKRNLSYEDAERMDAESLYRALKRGVIPTFFDRDSSGIPRRWIAMMRSAMRTIIPVYNTHRMVMEYCRKYYYP